MRVSSALPCLLLLLFSCGCATHKKVVSYSRIILEGDDNPTIREDPTRAGEITRVADRPRHQPAPEPQTPQ